MSLYILMVLARGGDGRAGSIGSTWGQAPGKTAVDQGPMPFPRSISHAVLPVGDLVVHPQPG